MSRTILLFLSCGALCCFITSVSSRYIDCAKECNRNARSPYCECKMSRLAMQWAKRGDHLPFRWGKRSLNIRSESDPMGNYGDGWYEAGPIDLSAYFQDFV